MLEYTQLDFAEADSSDVLRFLNNSKNGGVPGKNNNVERSDSAAIDNARFPGTHVCNIITGF